MTNEAQEVAHVNEVQRLEQLRADLERTMHLAGYAAALEEHGIELELTALALEQLHQEGDDLMSVAQVLRDAAAAAKQGAADVKTAIDSAIARLSDNPSAADIQAAIDDLNTANATNAEALAAAGTIDPDDTTGGVVDDGTGGVTEPTP